MSKNFLKMLLQMQVKFLTNQTVKKKLQHEIERAP